jgi:hypothetical protein
MACGKNRYARAEHRIKKSHIAKTFVKSLLTSLCQREEYPLFGKEGVGEICRIIFF